MNWKKVWVGVKVALGIAIKAQEKGLIKVKELPKIKDAVDLIDEQLPKPR